MCDYPGWANVIIYMSEVPTDNRYRYYTLQVCGLTTTEMIQMIDYSGGHSVSREYRAFMNVLQGGQPVRRERKYPQQR